MEGSHMNWKPAEELLSKIHADGRTSLYEHEVYQFLSLLGICQPIPHTLITPDQEDFHYLDAIPGDQIVLKIVHPRIAHKTEVEGVRIVRRNEVRENLSHFFSKVPENLFEYLNQREELPKGPSFASRENAIQTLKQEVVGVLVSECLSSKPGFGNELFVGTRSTREFGPILNIGLGGVDTELFAKSMKKGLASCTFSADPTVGSPDHFEQTLAFQTLTGTARGHEKVIQPETLLQLIEQFRQGLTHFSHLNSEAPFWFTEFEINPFFIQNERPVAVDGLLRFKTAEKKLPSLPIQKIQHLLLPKTACIVGVSSKNVNVGRTILRNLLEGKLKEKDLYIVKKGDESIDGVTCYPSIESLPQKVDLLVLTTPAQMVPEMIEQIVAHDKAQSIILVTGGMGEKQGGETLEAHIRSTLRESRTTPTQGPIMVGGNSLGVVSRMGGYNTLFIPETKLPLCFDHPLGKNTAILSQSGAFAISRMSKMGGFVPQVVASTGNQVDLGIGDFLEYLECQKHIQTFGCYVEGFRPHEGLQVAKAAQKLISQGKDIIVYKVGRSEAGRNAASGHTAAVAGDWSVAHSILEQAGCTMAETFDEWLGLLMLSSLLHKRKPKGRGLAVISNAGYETVGIADHAESFQFASYETKTRERIGQILETYRLAGLQDIRNPMDLTPMAVDHAHAEVLKALAQDQNVDIIVHGCVPLTQALKTREPDGPEGPGTEHPESFANLVVKACTSEITKPVIVVVDSGSEYDAMANVLLQGGVPVFRSADTAMLVLNKWMR